MSGDDNGEMEGVRGEAGFKVLGKAYVNYAGDAKHTLWR